MAVVLTVFVDLAVVACGFGGFRGGAGACHFQQISGRISECEGMPLSPHGSASVHVTGETES